MSLDDDLFHAAVGAAEGAIRFLLWDVRPERVSKVAEAAVRAAQPFLDGTERARVTDAPDGDTVTT